MNFHFNEEEQEILNMLEDFAAKEVGIKTQQIKLIQFWRKLKWQ